MSTLLDLFPITDLLALIKNPEKLINKMTDSYFTIRQILFYKNTKYIHFVLSF